MYIKKLIVLNITCIAVLPLRSMQHNTQIRLKISFILNEHEHKPTGNLYTCDYCPLIYTHRLDWETHMIEQHGPKPFVCHEGDCDYRAATVRSLVSHIQCKYGELPGSCPLCSKSAFIRKVLRSNLCPHHAEQVKKSS